MIRDVDQAASMVERGVYELGRPCLVCEQRCFTEGQLCVGCAAQGHRVTDDAVYLNISFDWPTA